LCLFLCCFDDKIEVKKRRQEERGRVLVELSVTTDELVKKEAEVREVPFFSLLFTA
jgi:hypothetical protein